MELIKKKEPAIPQADHRAFCDYLAQELGHGVEVPESTGLYLASPDAGMQPSVAFWALALEQGPGFMSPQNFPWTLANSPAAHLAIALGIRGPNFTFVGAESATAAAVEQAEWDLEAGLVNRALVLTVHFAEGDWQLSILGEDKWKEKRGKWSTEAPDE